MSQELKVADQIYEIPMTELVINESANCRTKIDPMDVIELWRTIENEGLIQPVTVRKVKTGYELVCGFRRYKAHVVGLATTIKARIINCSNEDVKVLNVIENLERKQLNPIEEAKAVEKFMFKGWTQARIAERFRVTKAWVVQRQNLLKMPECIQQEVASGLVTMGHVGQLLKLDGTIAMVEAVKSIKDATLRGQKVATKVLRPTAPTNVLPKTSRTRKEIQDMLLFIMSKTGPGFHTRCLSWCSGEITTDAFNADIVKEQANVKR